MQTKQILDVNEKVTERVKAISKSKEFALKVISAENYEAIEDKLINLDADGISKAIDNIEEFFGEDICKKLDSVCKSKAPEANRQFKIDYFKLLLSYIEADRGIDMLTEELKAHNEQFQNELNAIIEELNNGQLLTEQFKAILDNETSSKEKKEEARMYLSALENVTNMEFFKNKIENTKGKLAKETKKNYASMKTKFDKVLKHSNFHFQDASLLEGALVKIYPDNYDEVKKLLYLFYKESVGTKKIEFSKAIFINYTILAIATLHLPEVKGFDSETFRKSMDEVINKLKDVK